VLAQEARAALTARLRARRAPGERSAPPAVVPLNDGPAERPLVFFHALGGTVYPYGHLARELAADFRVFGVPAPLLEGGGLDELVTRHLAALQAAQGEGPYRLAGWSLGGMLAFEIARRLDPAQVLGVALLDSPSWLPDLGEPAAGESAGWFVADAARSLGPAAGERPDPSTTAVDDQLRWLAARLDPHADPDVQLPELTRRLAVFEGLNTAVAGYRPSGFLDADALVVDVEESPNSTGRWAAVLPPGVRLRRLPGTHYSFLQPPLVTSVAALLREGP
jgi:thioesterase domain-containing protein